MRNKTFCSAGRPSPLRIEMTLKSYNNVSFLDSQSLLARLVAECDKLPKNWLLATELLLTSSLPWQHHKEDFSLQ